MRYFHNCGVKCPMCSVSPLFNQGYEFVCETHYVANSWLTIHDLHAAAFWVLGMNSTHCHVWLRLVTYIVLMSLSRHIELLKYFVIKTSQIGLGRQLSQRNACHAELSVHPLHLCKKSGMLKPAQRTRESWEPKRCPPPGAKQLAVKTNIQVTLHGLKGLYLGIYVCNSN